MGRFKQKRGTVDYLISLGLIVELPPVNILQAKGFKSNNVILI